jgi:hypothetical protein
LKVTILLPGPLFQTTLKTFPRSMAYTLKRWNSSQIRILGIGENDSEFGAFILAIKAIVAELLRGSVAEHHLEPLHPLPVNECAG